MQHIYKSSLTGTTVLLENVWNIKDILYSSALPKNAKYFGDIISVISTTFNYLGDSQTNGMLCFIKS